MSSLSAKLISYFSFAEATVSSVHEEEESMYEIPQLRRTVSDSGYEKAVEVSVSVTSKSTSSDEQVIVTGEPFFT